MAGDPFSSKGNWNNAAAALAAGLLILAAAGPAKAQFYGGRSYQPYLAPEPLPAGEVRRGLQSQGYRMNGPLLRNGGVLLADVTDARGRSLRLIVDPHDGSVLQRFVNVEPRPARNVPGGLREPAGAGRPDYSESPALPDTPAVKPPPKKPAAKPTVAVRSLPAKPGLPDKPGLPAKPGLPDRPPAPSEAALAPVGNAPASPLPQENLPPRGAPEPAIAAASAERPNPPLQTAPAVQPQPQPSPAPSAAEKPGFVNGVPNNPLD